MSRIRVLVGVCIAGWFACVAGLFLAAPVGAQFEGGIFGGRGTNEELAAAARGQLLGRDGVVFSGGVIVAVSPKRDAVYGYSPTKGEWERQELNDVGQNRLFPTVTAHLASVQVGKRVYAYSGKTGTWGVLDLEDALDAVTHHPEMIVVDNDEGLHIFSADSGRWASLELPRETGGKD